MSTDGSSRGRVRRTGPRDLIPAGTDRSAGPRLWPTQQSRSPERAKAQSHRQGNRTPLRGGVRTWCLSLKSVRPIPRLNGLRRTSLPTVYERNPSVDRDGRAAGKAASARGRQEKAIWWAGTCSSAAPLRPAMRSTRRHRDADAGSGPGAGREPPSAGARPHALTRGVRVLTVFLPPPRREHFKNPGHEVVGLDVVPALHNDRVNDAGEHLLEL
jgi:hypothetical protein